MSKRRGIGKSEEFDVVFRGIKACKKIMQTTFDPELVIPEEVRVTEFTGDNSLSRKDLCQHPIPADSLIWKYWGRFDVMYFGSGVLGPIAGAWPQMGRGTAGSVLFNGDSSFRARAKIYKKRRQRSREYIYGSVYDPPEDAKKYGLKTRNMHKSVKGTLQDGTFHALNAETFYFAHVTFFYHHLMVVTERLHFDGDMPRAVKEQIFEESKEWYSIWGVDDGPQPDTYDDFERYLENVERNHLVRSQVTQLMLEQFMERRLAPRWWPTAMKKFVWPWLVGRRQVVVSSYPPHVRELFALEWTPEDEEMLRRFMDMYRRCYAVLERLLPVKCFYLPAAVRGFEREGIDPRNITLESARQALRDNRARRAPRENAPIEGAVAAGQ
ncbi:oxygenase MpaB family protein [Mycobacteroides abscessus]|uniref:oxygenase MpaB family protein n=1 Tax=Mycobacteroides abscessus TaxID=36809 RepID=UPI0009A6B7C5|nr:oxygenase MpaB family protein [Mycobacteroides abscessus]